MGVRDGVLNRNYSPVSDGNIFVIIFSSFQFIAEFLLTFLLSSGKVRSYSSRRERLYKVVIIFEVLRLGKELSFQFS